LSRIFEAVREGDVETIAAWLFLMLQWWMPTCLIGTVFAFAELVPRLLAPHLLGLAVLWAAVAGAVAWGTWWVKRKLSTRWMLKAMCVVIGGVALMAVAAAGHWLLSVSSGG
jgi:hypothetical protein